MISDLDKLLRHLFVTRVPALPNENQIGFQPPNADWITFVKGLGEIALNVYLVGFTENLELRSNERLREIHNGVVQETRAPRRLDCHYLITAWNPAAPLPPLVEPTLEEHDLLFAVATVLSDAEPMVPSRILGSSLPAAFPGIRDDELPSELLPFEGFPPTPDFWSTMEGPWKPGLQLTVTLPLLYTKQEAGKMVITRITEYRQIGGVGAAEVFIQIGGHVLTGMPPAPVSGAWVRLETPGALPLQTTETGADGRFTFVQLAAGSYVLRVRVMGFAEVTRNISVPAATGGYDVQLV